MNETMIEQIESQMKFYTEAVREAEIAGDKERVLSILKCKQNFMDLFVKNLKPATASVLPFKRK